jgi:hypothetical protein
MDCGFTLGRLGPGALKTFATIGIIYPRLPDGCIKKTKEKMLGVEIMST